jgi:phage terminase large subunit
MGKVDVHGTVNLEFLLECHDNPVIDTVIFEGSTRSTKTYSIIQYLIIKWCVEQPGSVVRVFRYDSTTHNSTTIADFKEIMRTLDLWDEGSWNGQEKVFRWSNGSIFAFSATSDPQKLHGLKQHVAFFNEAMEIQEDAYTQTSYRTTHLTIFDFNPSYNKHWLFEQFIDVVLPNVAYKHSTYKDNPFLTPKQIGEIEKYEPTPENKKRGTADAYKWSVWGLGERGRVEGAIFKLFDVVDFFPDPRNCQRYGLGLDFGFSLDPTAIVECALFQDGLYLRELCYETGLITTENTTRPGEPSIEGVLNELSIDKEVKIYADCACPQQIQDLRFSGFNVVPCVKGPGSVLQGLDLMRQRKIYIHKASHNLRMEMEHYTWKRGIRDGEWKRDPIDKWNHLIDGARYWSMAELQMQKFQQPSGGRAPRSNTILSRRNYR